MQVHSTKIPDIKILEPTIHRDARGYFMETFKKTVLEEALGFSINFVQDNESYSSRGVLRGLHFQTPPYAQSKLVRVIQGSVLDVAVDIRVGSPTFGKHVCIEMNDQNNYQVFIPRGFAHGFLVLSKTALFSYKVDNPYSLLHDKGISFSDPELNIHWPFPSEELSLSPKDLKQPLLSNCSTLFNYKDNLYV